MRYNPDGVVKRDGVKHDIDRPAREQVLIECLYRIRDGRRVFEDSFNLAYLFYPTIGDLPTMCYDEGYDDAITGAIRDCL